MERFCSVYQRRGKIYVQAQSRTTTGLLLVDGDVHVVDEDIPEGVLGETIVRSLGESRQIPHPKTTKGLLDPLLKAMGVRSWRSLIQGCWKADVAAGEVIEVESSRNLGAREGFAPILPARQLPASVSAAELGRAVRDALDRCE